MRYREERKGKKEKTKSIKQVLFEDTNQFLKIMCGGSTNAFIFPDNGHCGVEVSGLYRGYTSVCRRLATHAVLCTMLGGLAAWTDGLTCLPRRPADC